MRGTTGLAEAREHDSDERAYALGAKVSILVATILRLWQITSVSTLNLHIIRQMVAAMQARHFADGYGNVLRPLIDVAFWPIQPHTPVAIGLEPPLGPLAVGLFSRVFGFQAWYGNVLSVALAAASAWLVYLLVRRFTRHGAAALACLLVFLFAPEAYKYARTFQPETLVTLASLACVWFTVCWTDSEAEDGPGSRRAVTSKWAAVGMLALTVFAKANYAFIILVVLVAVVARFGWRRLISWDALLAVLFVLGPALAYYVPANLAADGSQAAYTLGAAAGGFATNWLQPTFWFVLGGWLGAWFFLPGLAAVAIGVFTLRGDRYPRHDNVMLWGWLAAVFVFFEAMGPTILAPHSYYFLPAWPIGCILIGRAADVGLGALAGARARWMPSASTVATIAVAAALVAAAGSAWMLRGYYAETAVEMRVLDSGAALIERSTGPEDKIVFQTEDWGVSLYLSFASRRLGWQIDTGLGRQPFLREITAVRQAGARYLFVSTLGTGDRYVNSPEERAGLANQLASARDAYREVGTSAEGVLFDLR
jgi:hypothetical protein